MSQSKSWYTSTKPDALQGLIIDESTGRNIAVSYDPKDAPLIAAAPALFTALKNLLQEATWDDDSDRATFDVAYAEAQNALALVDSEDA